MDVFDIHAPTKHARVPPQLKFTIWHFECSETIEICDKIIFDFFSTRDHHIHACMPSTSLYVFYKVQDMDKLTTHPQRRYVYNDIACVGKELQLHEWG